MYLPKIKYIEPTIIYPANTSRDKTADISPSLTKAWFLLVGEEQHQLDPELTKLGRGENNHIQVDDLKASRLHAEITSKGENLEIVDLGSTNGTFVNHQKLSAHTPHELNDGDMISIGKIQLVVNEGQEIR